jgi:hypothetical protein
MERIENLRKRSKKLPSFSLRSEIKRNGSKKLPLFSLRSEMKRNGSEKLPSFSLQSEMKRNRSEILFASMRKEGFFASFRIWSETKMKWSENKTKKKQSETNNFLKRNKAKICSINFALVGSEKFEAKRSEKNFFFAWACETDLVSLRFALKRKIFFCETGAP